MRASIPCTLLVAVLWSAMPLSAQQLVNLPVGSWANDVTPDGEVVVGTWNYGDGFLWRWKTDPAPTVIPGGNVVGVSDDGSVVCGTIFDQGIGADVAAIWTEATGWQSLGWLPGALSCPSRSTGYDISGDGTTVVGLSWEGCNGRGFRWTAATGMQELQPLANGGNRCTAISGDGSTLAGFAQGTFSRTPAYWAPDLSGFVLDPDFQGEVLGLDESGRFSVGTMYQGGSDLWYDAFVRDRDSGAITNLGSLADNWAASATDLSEDGSVIVGFDYKSTSRRAWIWTSTDGLISLDDRLAAAGIAGAPPMLVCRAVSDDGSVIVGGAATGGGPFDTAGFIAELTFDPSPWTDLGNGLAGTGGVPLLGATGPLTPGSATSILLTNGLGSAQAAFAIGFSAAFLPFKQGVLVPFPDLLVLTPLAPSGSVGWNLTWPAGLPAGSSTWWQVIVQDPGGPAGYALSNALRGTTP